jgi:hypothetical protein
METPLKNLLRSAGMLDCKEEDAFEKPCPLGSRIVWYLQHGDFHEGNPDGLAMAEINLP